jgi:peptidoglycan/xylan/chitin deacetylase (PgdA/CDA1 family)
VWKNCFESVIQNLYMLNFLLLLLKTNAQFANYQCDPNVCRLPTCKCATLEPPIENPPQFILIQFDDSIQSSLLPQARALFANRRNPNGCPATATWYTQVLYSDPFLATEWVAQGNEIGDHSVTHSPPFAGSYEEIEGMRRWAREFAGVHKVTGMRYPFRNYSKDSIEMLARLGFEYDSSFSTVQRMWPFTMDHGMVLECWNSQSFCGQSVNAPGLWEIPMVNTQGPQGLHLMDIYNDYSITNPIPPEQVTSTLLTNFNEHYNGNRAPFGIFTHPVWLGPAIAGAIPDGSQKLAAVNRFLDQAMRNPNVWIVTGQQLIQYMRNPVPASQLGSQSYMQCTESPPTNICNGVSQTGVQQCNLPSVSMRVSQIN